PPPTSTLSPYTTLFRSPPREPRLGPERLADHRRGKQHLQLRRAYVAAAADQRHTMIAQRGFQLQCCRESGRTRRLDERPSLLDHHRRRGVDLVVGDQDEVVQQPAQDALRKLEGR